MKKWYKQSFFDRKNWILENFDKLSLTSDEVLLLLLIELAKDNKEQVSYDYLKQKMNYDGKRVDEIVASLVNKTYLSIKPTNNGIIFDIDSLFEFDPEKYETIDAKDVYTIAEELIKRPLSGNEVQKLSDLVNEFSQDKVIDGLRVAEAYRKNSIAYVESVIRNEKR